MVGAGAGSQWSPRSTAWRVQRRNNVNDKHDERDGLSAMQRGRGEGGALGGAAVRVGRGDLMGGSDSLGG